MEITYKIIDAEAVKKIDAFYGEGMSVANRISTNPHAPQRQSFLRYSNEP